MNYGKFKLAQVTSRALAAAAIVSAFSFVSTSALAVDDPMQTRVEARIKDMHAKLKITPAEEAQWAQVADVMRDNAKTMNEMNSARATNAKSMTALDDLKTYAQITDAHAGEIKKFSVAFEPLYASMSDAQKSEADALFRHGEVAQKATQKK